ncbi:MAG: glutamate mutase L, partial [Sulfurovum sp.]
MVENKLLVDVGSTYFKVCANGTVEQHFRDFNKDIYDDLTSKCGDTITSFDKENVYICSSANGGLTTLIIGITNNFSLKFATNIAYNSGINIINTILYQDIEEASIPSEQIDVVILVGGIDSINNVFDDRLYNFIENLNYSNVVFAGTKQDADTLNAKIENLVVVDNIINNKLHVVEEPLKNYLTNLYQSNIMGKEDIKHLYDLTSNQIYSTPYIVNKTLPLIDAKFAAVNP